MKKIIFVFAIMMAALSVSAQWVSTHSEDLMYMTERWVFISRAVASVNKSINEPSLVIRYENGEMEIYIAWGQYIDNEDYLPVIMRIDTSTPIPYNMSVSTDNTATFYMGDSILFLNNIIDKKEIVAAVKKYDNVQVVAKFSLAGLRDEMMKYPIIAELIDIKP